MEDRFRRVSSEPKEREYFAFVNSVERLNNNFYFRKDEALPGRKISQLSRKRLA